MLATSRDRGVQIGRRSVNYVADRVANAVQCAMAEIADGAGLAECGAIIPPSTGVISGIDPKTGHAFVNQIFLGITGGAGGPLNDAWLTIGHVGNGGLVFVDSVELDELRQPIHVYERRLLPDTEGAGRRRGASSLLVEFGPVGCDISVGYVSDGVFNRPHGVRGGLAGGRADQVRIKIDGSEERMPPCGQVTIADGERVRSLSTGGGGYGAPTAREAERVARDVAERWISASRAEEVYRVVLDAAGNVDAAATARARSGAEPVPAVSTARPDRGTPALLASPAD